MSKSSTTTARPIPAGVTSAEFWMHLQVQHDLWHAIRKVASRK